MTLRPADRLVILGATFVALTVLVGTGVTDAIDKAALELVLPLRTPVGDDAFQLITIIGAPLVASVIAIALTLVLVAREGRRGLIVLLMFAGIAIEAAMKQVVFQPGPPSELVRDSSLLVTLRDLSPYTYPSGHAMRLVFLAALLVTRYPRAHVPVAVIVALVAFGRIYLAAGWLADIAGGLLLGLALGAAAELIDERLRSPRVNASEVPVSP